MSETDKYRFYSRRWYEKLAGKDLRDFDGFELQRILAEAAERGSQWKRSVIAPGEPETFTVLSHCSTHFEGESGLSHALEIQFENGAETTIHLEDLTHCLPVVSAAENI